MKIIFGSVHNSSASSRAASTQPTCYADIQQTQNNSLLSSHTHTKFSQISSPSTNFSQLQQQSNSSQTHFLLLPPPSLSPMDSWASLPVHDEYQKLVIRMNPPRYNRFPYYFLHSFSSDSFSFLWDFLTTNWVFKFYLFFFPRFFVFLRGF